MPCSGAKSDTSFTFFASIENVDRRLPCEISAGVVCDETDAFAFELFEVCLLEDVDSVINDCGLRIADCGICRG